MISVFHTKLRVNHGSARQAETEVTTPTPASSPELLNLQAHLVEFEEKENKRSETRRGKKFRRQERINARLSSGESEKTDNVEQVGIIPTLSTSSGSNLLPCGTRDRFLFDTGCNVVKVLDVRHIGNGLAQTSTLNIRVADDHVSKIAVEGRFEGVRAAGLPHTKGGLIPAKVVTPNTIVVLRDDDMIVISGVSQLGVHISTTVDSAPSVVIQRTNGVYPMSGKIARDVVLGKNEGVQLNGLANATTYFSSKIGTMYELVKFWHEALGHPSLDDMIRMSDSVKGWPKKLSVATLRKHF